MNAFLAGFHLIAGAVMFVAGVSAAKDSWKTPALILLAGGVFAIAIGIGIIAERPWVRWLIGLLMVVVSIVAVFLLAGSIVWPESAGLIIVLIYALFLLVEVATWRQLRRSTKGEGFS
jgi:hypothetical protein